MLEVDPIIYIKQTQKHNTTLQNVGLEEFKYKTSFLLTQPHRWLDFRTFWVTIIPKSLGCSKVGQTMINKPTDAYRKTLRNTFKTFI